MFGPMKNADASVMAAISGAFSSAASNIQRWSWSTGPSPNGRSGVWCGAAAEASTEIARSEVMYAMAVVRSQVNQLRSAAGLYHTDTGCRLQVVRVKESG